MEIVAVKADSGRTYDVGLVQSEYQMAMAAGKSLTVPIYDERYISVLADDMMFRPIKKFDTILKCTGERRTGKSTICTQLARTIDKSFPLSHMTFRLGDFNQVLKNNPYADPDAGVFPQVFLDEAGFDLFSQNWMERMQRNMVKKFQVIGLKRQIVYLVLPHRDFLNKKLREGMAQFWLNTEVRKGERGLVELRRGVPNKWSLEKYWAPHAAFTFKDMDADPWWDEYLIKKTAFIDEVTADTEDDEAPQGRNWRKDWATQRYQSSTLSHADVAAELGVPLSTISRDLKGVSKTPK